MDRFRDGNDDSVFVTRLKWKTEFPNEGPGAYTVVLEAKRRECRKEAGLPPIAGPPELHRMRRCSTRSNTLPLLSMISTPR